MKQLTYLITIILFLGCSSSKKNILYNETKPEQYITKFIHTKGVQKIDDSNYKHNFSTNYISKLYFGFDGSHLFYGNFNLVNKYKIDFSPIDSIKIEINSKYNWQHFLQDVKSYKLKDEHFTLKSKSKRTLDFQIYPFYSSTIIEKYWKLRYLNKEEITEVEKDIYFIIKNDSNNASGYNGCNNFFCGYKIDEKNNKISFENIAQTKKACLNKNISEKEINNIFIKAENFINIDDYLILLDSNYKNLAVFEAIYFQKQRNLIKIENIFKIKKNISTRVKSHTNNSKPAQYAFKKQQKR